MAAGPARNRSEFAPLTEEDLTALKQSVLHAALPSAAARSALEGVALPSRAFAADTDLLREGGAIEHLHIVTEGWACRYKTTRDGSRQIVALVVPGDIANLQALMFARSDFGVRLLTPAKALAIPREAALQLADEHVGISRAFTWLTLVENVILSQWALSLGRKQAQVRIAHLLCELLLRLAGGEKAGRGSFRLPLTQEQLGDTLGLTAVHVNRSLQQMRAMGLIEVASRIVTVPDIARLSDFAEFDPAYLHQGDGGPPVYRVDSQCGLQVQSY